MATALAPRDRLTLSIEREIRRTYGVGRVTHQTYGSTRTHGAYWTTRYVHNAYVTPLILEIVEFDSTNEWGDTCTVEVEYATEGYRAVFGGHFDSDSDLWVWACYMD